jgi:hypothetical protein
MKPATVSACEGWVAAKVKVRGWPGTPSIGPLLEAVGVTTATVAVL